ncbi:MAG: ribosome maturation factor RimP [Clostridia bacterium]|nr:ribosome maturation factor RimP [Clostridia bacterium]
MANNTADKVRELVEPTVQALGLRVWDVRYVKEGAAWYLRVYIDSDDGININDCTEVSRRIDPILDAADPISTSYYLEVCSPGLERELTRPEHFAAMQGRSVQVHLVRPIEGQRDFTGILTGWEDGSVTLTAESGVQTFEKAMISKVKLNDCMEEKNQNG